MGKKEGGKPHEPRKGKVFRCCNIKFRIDLWRDFGDCLMMQEANGRWSDVAWSQSGTDLKRVTAPAIAREERIAREIGEE